MRITNSMMISGFLTNLNNNTMKLDKYGTQLSSNKKISRISQNPVGMISSLNARQRLNGYRQYQENLTLARNWVDQTETSLMDISSNLTEIKEQLTRASTGTMTPSDKKNVAVLLREYKDHIMQSLNMTMGDRYIFGGFNVNSAPFADNAGVIEYNGIDLGDTTPGNMALITAEQQNRIQFEIGYELSMELSFTGIDIAGIGSDNVFVVLDDIINELESGTPDNTVLSGYIANMTKLQDNVMSKIVVVGSRSTKLDLLENRYSQDIIDYEQIKSNIEDVDQAEAIMYLKMAEVVYRQSLSVGGRVIQPTLMDYLR